MQQIKAWVDQDIAAAFKAVCAAVGVSMSSEISHFMAERAEILKQSYTKTESKIENRGGRRKEVKTIIQKLEKIREAEDDYKHNIPENLTGGAAYESAVQAVDMIEQAIELLQEAF
jgi:antitoxin component of RelBE/YafQ-DinJ toxin-antitoxin module